MRKTSRDLAIILAAGKGSRLNIDYPKPLFKIDGISIIESISKSLINAGNMDILVVVGYKKEKIIKHLGSDFLYVTQNKPKGTGDAVLQCLEHIKKYKNVFVLVGDAPFINSLDISKLREEHEKNNSSCSFLYSKFPFSLPYARLKFDKSESISGLVEFSSASRKELKIRKMFTSHYIFNSTELSKYVFDIKPDKLTGEYNLTDIINIYLKNRLKIKPVLIEKFWTLMGVNTLDDLRIIRKYIKK